MSNKKLLCVAVMVKNEEERICRTLSSIVEYTKNVVILDTGYRGAPSNQSGLDQALADRGLPPEIIQGGPSGASTFLVNSLSPVYVYVYAPMSGTSFTTLITCPT